MPCFLLCVLNLLAHLEYCWAELGERETDGRRDRRETETDREKEKEREN